MHRSLIELSGMRNNDEMVLFSPHCINHEDVAKVTTRSAFSKPRLVFCRPVAQAELDQGLDTTYTGSAWDEKPPQRSPRPWMDCTTSCSN